MFDLGFDWRRKRDLPYSERRQGTGRQHIVELRKRAPRTPRNMGVKKRCGERRKAGKGTRRRGASLLLRQAKDLNKRDDLLRSSLAEKDGFALQRAPIGDRETTYCRAAQACTSHAAKYGCEEKVWGAKKSGKGNAAARSIPLAAPSKRPQQT